ncbi:hypothetical protein DBV15_04567 [Temnothorax longispinosus]|uniref:Uncharacterized protein n=1 Tax=Temnothorax longispinosus TaxID=300112 RepID=A0A4S2KFI4_9HYME|nr:hypothetical protein DBV15_04567 [Temnothorax longispinosus]
MNERIGTMKREQRARTSVDPPSGIARLICPITLNNPRDNSIAWHPGTVREVARLSANFLQFVNAAVCDSRSFPKSVLPVVHPLYYPISWLRTGRRNKCDTFSTAALDPFLEDEKVARKGLFPLPCLRMKKRQRHRSGGKGSFDDGTYHQEAKRDSISQDLTTDNACFKAPFTHSDCSLYNAQHTTRDPITTRECHD